MAGKAGGRAKQLDHLEVLVRRRDFLGRQITLDMPEPSAWDKREHTALTWAIEKLVECPHTNKDGDGRCVTCDYHPDDSCAMARVP